MEKLDRYLQTALEEYCPEEGIKQAIWDRLKKEIDWRDANPAGLFNYPAAGLQQIFQLVFSHPFYPGNEAWEGKKNFMVIL